MECMACIEGWVWAVAVTILLVATAGGSRKREDD